MTIYRKQVIIKRKSDKFLWLKEENFMKKRFLTVFLTLLTVIIASNIFIACSDNNETPPPSSCEHVGDGSGYCALCDEIIGTTDGVVYISTTQKTCTL